MCIRVQSTDSTTASVTRLHEKKIYIRQPYMKIRLFTSSRCIRHQPVDCLYVDITYKCTYMANVGTYCNCVESPSHKKKILQYI
jgi:hypothetical protein